MRMFMLNAVRVRARLALVLAVGSGSLAGCGLGDHIDPSAVRRPVVSPGANLAGRTGVPNGEPSVGFAGSTRVTPDDIAKIRDEGLHRSHVMDTLDTLCNAIGPRLTSSPNGIKASNWTRDQLEQWGLSNAHLEEWGPFGRSWVLKRWSLQVTDPVNNTLIAFPKAWSPGLPGEGTVESEVVYLEADSRDELEKFKGRLAGKIVLIGDPRVVEAHFDPEATRRTDEDLAKMAFSPSREEIPKGNPDPKQLSAGERRAEAAANNPALSAMMRQQNRDAVAAASQPSAARGPATRSRRRGNGLSSSDLFTFAAEEKVALVLTPSTKGDGGTLFVAQASLPGPAGTSLAPDRIRVWNKPASDAMYLPAQAMLSIEDFNRLTRAIAKGVTPRMAAELKVDMSDEEKPSFNTVAEIPGTDPALKDEIVMVGAHLDSWHSASGATDNGAGSACAMEAVRILKAAGLQPRRTIRVALWTGEEEGLHGSHEYVAKHFGSRPKGKGGATQPVVQQPDYDKFQLYINLDNGTGKIRGVYCQGNAAAAPVFQQWLIPFNDLGARTVTLSNTGGTDHLSFNEIGLPGFQFIQDGIEYFPRTHHSNQDNYDRIQPDDMRQASTIMAAFLWDAAQMDGKFPRKPAE